jgi:hypothetical protein
MFYRSKDQMKAQLEERLRTALEFATLGAYETDAPAHEAPSGPQTRVFLFAKVSPPCPHSAAAPRRCDAAGAEMATCAPSPPAGRPVVGTRRALRARRGGMAKAPAQPCTWAAEPRV